MGISSDAALISVLTSCFGYKVELLDDTVAALSESLWFWVRQFTILWLTVSISGVMNRTCPRVQYLGCRNFNSSYEAFALDLNVTSLQAHAAKMFLCQVRKGGGSISFYVLITFNHSSSKIAFNFLLSVTSPEEASVFLFLEQNFAFILALSHSKEATMLTSPLFLYWFLRQTSSFSD